MNENLLYYGDNLDVMAPRLVELRRVLRPTGSIYLQDVWSLSRFQRKKEPSQTGHFRPDATCTQPAPILPDR